VTVFPTHYPYGMRLTLLLLLVVFCTCLSAQKVLLFEKLTASKSERIYEGDYLRFKMKGDKFWQEGYIREMRPDIQALVINDRFIVLDEIALVDRGTTIAARIGIGMVTFGVAWSGFALVGYSLDGDSTTSYSTGDALVSATSIAAGFAVFKLLGQRRFRPGKYKRLRVVDLSF